MVVALASALAGCALESDEPAESTEASAVTVGTWNYVQVPVLALRSCDSPSGCIIGGMSCGIRTYVDYVDFNTHMARLPNMPGWALADGSTGPNLSVTPPNC